MSNGNNADWWARVTAIAGIILTLCTFAYEHLRGPDLRVSTGKYVYIQGWPRVGIPVGFYNNGAQVAIVHSGRLSLEDGSNRFRFKLTLFSPPGDKWTTDQASGIVGPETFSLFSQVIVKPGDSAEGVFWYSPERAEFKFSPDTKYTACLTFSDKGSDTGQGSESHCDLRVVFHVDATTATNADQRHEVVRPIRAED